MARLNIGWPLALALLILAAWANAWNAPFVFDDEVGIVENASIRDLGSLAWLRPPAARGESVGGRPVLNATLALNYAIGGLRPLGYRVTNILIHLAAAWTLFAIIRRIGRLAAARDAKEAVPDAFAFAVAGLWALHPVQTESVTYVVQRSESLMSLFYLLTLHAFLRAATPQRRSGWYGLSVLTCALGMATKENMVSAPIAVLLLDRAVVAGSFRAAWAERRAFYLALASTWLLLLALILSTGGNRGGSVGFGVSVRWWDYVLTQFPAAVRYLALCFWPHPLVIDYGDFWIRGLGEVAEPFLIVIGLAAATLFALARRPLLGFIAFVAFGVMAPTALVPGTLQMIVEHRMYLPLAAAWALIVLALYRTIGTSRSLPYAVGASMLALVVVTAARNRDYASELSLWSDAVAKRPDNPRAHNNLGVALRRAGRLDEAARSFRRTIALQPNHAFAHANLGMVLLQQHAWSAAADELRVAVRLEPTHADYRINLATALVQLNQTSEAVEQYQAALKLEPTATDAHVALGNLWAKQEQFDRAMTEFRAALAIDPELTDARNNLANCELATGAFSAAIEDYQRVLTKVPNSTAVRENLAIARQLLQARNQ